MIRVLVVDDQPTVAEGHRSYVERVPGFEVVGVAHDGQTAVARCAEGGMTWCCSTWRCPECTVWRWPEPCRRCRSART